MQKAIYDQVKKVKPTAQVGWHVDHQPSTWDFVYRAEMSYAEMAPYSDFIKIILYHDVAAPRVRNWYLERLRRGRAERSAVGRITKPVLRPVRIRQDHGAKAQRNERPRVFAGIRVSRNQTSVVSAAGKTKIYSGIGFNVPGSPRNTDPENVYKAVIRAFRRRRLGHCGVPEYEEMRLPNFNAVGRAAREVASKK